MTFDIDSAAQAQADAKARRERIATKCLQGLLASEDEDVSFCSPEGAALAAVKHADALIAELDKQDEPVSADFEQPTHWMPLPEVEQDLAGWVVVGPDGCMSDIQTDHCHAVDLKSDMDSELPPHHAGPAHEVTPLYLHPRPVHNATLLLAALERIKGMNSIESAKITARNALEAYHRKGGDV